MPPKGSKRAAPKEEAAAPAAEPASELRRSTRGGGHPAPEPASKPASKGKPRSKKAKTDKDEEAKEAAKEGENGDAAVPSESAAPADDKKADEPLTDGGKGVEVPEENKKVEKEVVESKANGSSKIEVGQQVPADLVLKNEKDEDVTIADLTKEKGAVFFVYPKANTPGCTNQACDFRDHYAEFGPLGYDVYGLSADSPKSQSSWKDKHNFPYHLLCDPGQILTKVLGAAKAGKNQRGHYIVEKGGKLVDAKYTVSPKDSCKLALEFIKGQSKAE